MMTELTSAEINIVTKMLREVDVGDGGRRAGTRNGP